MSKFTNPLENVKIASPCSADWNEMYGNEQKRFCGDCKLNVYNLSGMSKTEAETLIMNAEGRLCVRFYRRADGSVMTNDCPVGWAGVKHRARVFATAAASLMVAIFTGVFFVSLFTSKKTSGPGPHVTMGAIAISNSNREVDDRRYVMGKVATPPAKKRTMTEVKGEIDAPVVKKAS
jgi:hypothetical protein